MAKRITATHHPDVRSRIQSSMILNRLNSHVNGEVELTQTQVAAAKILLGKCLPDLSSVELTGNDDKPVTIIQETSMQTLMRYKYRIIKEYETTKQLEKK